MDFTRIKSVIDVDRLQSAEVAIIGCGGAAGLAVQLARCGVQQFTLIAPDHVTPTNVPRQAHDTVSLWTPKVDALAATLRRTNPAIVVRPLRADVTLMSDADIDLACGSANLLINATDRFAAHAKGNEIALRLGLPALWVGLYPQGQAGEIAWWTPDILACWRCLCPGRYAAHERARTERRSIDPASDGCTIFDITLLDSIAGMLAVALLTRGADNRFGRWIEQLGDRNFLQVQLDPSWSLNGRNPIRELLGVNPDAPAWFAWNVAVQADPDRGTLPCQDCERFRGHRFTAIDGRATRVTTPLTSAVG
jgi:molybdopterin/thiamine biosynthesis adenylyltransferase